MIKKIIERTLDEFVNWLKKEGRSGSWKGYQTFFAPFLGLIGWLLIQEVLTSKTSIILLVIVRPISILLVYLFSIFVSNFMVHKMLRVSLINEIFIKYSAYEKRDNEYYLKEKVILKRNYFDFFNGYLEVLFLIIFDVLKICFLDFVKSENIFSFYIDIIESILLWWTFKTNYLNGITWRERQEKNSVNSSDRSLIERDVWKSVRKEMKNAMGCFLEYISAFYTELDEKKSFPDRYRELFVTLKNEESVYITNGFYHDWERALFIPIHRFLLNDQKVIILMGRSMDENAVMKWIDSELESMIGSSDSWQIKVWRTGCIKWDITVVCYNDIPYFAREFGEYEAMKGVFVLVLEPSSMILEIRPYLEIMADRLKTLEKEPVYCLADREMTGLLDTFSHIFRTKIQGISIDFSKCSNLRYYGIDDTIKINAKKYWGVLDYWGNGSVIAAELLKKGKRIVYSSNAISAILDMRDSLKGKILTPMFSLREQNEIIEKVEKSCFINSLWEIERQKDSSIIVDDDNRNFYDICNLMSGRGREWSDIYVISGEYVLKKYMWEHAQSQMFIKDIIPVYFPIYEDTERNRIMKLLYRGYYEEIPLESVVEMFPGNGTGESLELKINNMISKYFFFSQDVKVVTIKNERSLAINEMFIRNNEWWLDDVYFVDEENEDKELGCRKMGQLYQYYLPGQYIVLDGRYYMVHSFDKTNNKDRMLLRRSSSLSHQSIEYRQKRFYEITNLNNTTSMIINSDMKIKVGRGNIEVMTVGLTEIKSWDWINVLEEKNGEKYFRCSNVPKRHYKNKKILHLELCDSISLSKEQRLKSYDGLAVLLTELAKTVFPYHYPYLAILPVVEPDMEWTKFYLYQLAREKTKKYYTEGILILEDSMEDIGILETIVQHFPRIMNLCYEYCDWAIDKNERFMRNPNWPEMAKSIMGIWEKKNQKTSNQGHSTLENANIGIKQSAATAEKIKSEEAKEEMNKDMVAAYQETSASISLELEEERRKNISSSKMYFDILYKANIRRWRCVACGAELPTVNALGIREYCEECKEKENQLRDYKNSFEDVKKWLERHMGISINTIPKIAIKWWWGKSKFAIGYPIKVKGILGTKKISCREIMKAECINVHMIRVCVELWILRNREKLNKNMDKEPLGIYRRLIPPWFQVQYLYLTQSEEDAKNFEEGEIVFKPDLWKKLVVKCPFVYKNSLSVQDVENLYEKNPIAVLKRGESLFN